MFFFNNKISTGRILRYVFFVALTIWILVSIPIFYKYVRSSSTEIVSKGGTFVEGIFSNTSYLPYLSNTPESLFYQGLLFRGCQKYTINKNRSLTFINDLCQVSTKDNKKYTLALLPGNTWSDGAPLSLDDLYFTYKTILVDNALGIKYLDEYNGINIEKQGNTLVITFPIANKDNQKFFVNYILPKHALESPNIDMYQQSFALEPVYNNCGKIYSQSTDQYSLVFDLTQCMDTNLWLYQVKKLPSFDDFRTFISNGKTSIIDAYEGQETLTGYKTKTLHTDKYMTLFMNTKSQKLLVRTRRSLGGLIHHTLSHTKDIHFIDLYTGALFNHYLSTGTNIKDFLDNAMSTDRINEKSIKDSGIKNIPDTISIKGTSQAYSYYTKNTYNTTYYFSVDKNYSKIGISDNENQILYYPKSYNSAKKTFKYIIGKKVGNLKNGLNSYTIYGFDKKNKKIKLASIKLYLIEDDEDTVINSPSAKLKIVYYKNPLNQYISDILKKVFSKNNISNYFSFEGFEDESTFHGILTNGAYDIAIGSINSSLKEAFYGFLNTDQAILNPSMYTNTKLSSLLQQYGTNQNQALLDKINKIYSTDLPFLILGNEQKPLAIKPNIIEKLGKDITFHEYNRRNKIYSNLILTKNIYVDSKELLNISNFYNYITNKH